MSRFVVDVVDNSLALTGPGPLYNVISVEIVEEIDRAGTISLVVPASDERALALVGTESIVRFRSPDGLTAYGRLQQSALSGGSDNKVNRTLSGQDLLGELLFPTTGPAAEYNNASTASIINALLASSTFTAGSERGGGRRSCRPSRLWPSRWATTSGRAAPRARWNGEYSVARRFGGSRTCNVRLC